MLLAIKSNAVPLASTDFRRVSHAHLHMTILQSMHVCFLEIR
jgi:hypothetical protein